MNNKKIDKHFQISEELLKKLENNKMDNFTSTVAALEYYLDKGLTYSEYIDSLDEIKSDIKHCVKKIYYLEKLLEQLFVNKGFACNMDPKKDLALKDFKNNMYKDSFND